MPTDDFQRCQSREERVDLELKVVGSMLLAPIGTGHDRVTAMAPLTPDDFRHAQRCAVGLRLTNPGWISQITRLWP
jgi:hypothetical protein